MMPLHNVHKHGITRCAIHVMGYLMPSHGRHEVSIDRFGDVRVRKPSVTYAAPMETPDIVGTYTRSYPFTALMSDMRAHCKTLRPIYHRQPLKKESRNEYSTA